MKNVQIIDGAVNCTYKIYQFSDEQFALIFPGPGQNIEFIEDVLSRLSERDREKAVDGVWDRPVRKADVQGIHGTLFYELPQKRKYYPTKSEDDVANFA